MKQENIILRAYRASDLKPLSAIWLAASLDAHAFIGAERLQAQRRLIETQYLPKAETWVACVDDEPVGFIGLLDHFVGGLFVAPGWQGRGIGRRLIRHAAGLKGRLELEVYTANAGACAFYAALGFEEVSRRATDDEGQPFENARLILRG